MKKSIKKVFALGASVALLATTMVGALADLSKYPAPFVDDNGVFNGAIVVGENAATADVLGAIDIAASLQSEAKRPIAYGGEEVIVEGGEDFDELPLNAVANALTGVYDETELSGFLDDETVEIEDEDVDYHDELVVDGSLIKPATSLVDDDFGADPYLQVDESALIYRVTFDDEFNQSAVDADNDIEIKFAGQTLTIVDISDDQIKVEASTDKSMIEGDEVVVGGKTVKLVRVGESSAIIDVDGQTKVVDKNVGSTDNTETFDEADDFEVTVESIFYIEGASDNIANVKLVADSDSSTAKHGEPAEILGETDEKNEADWLWNIRMDQGNLTAKTAWIGVELNIPRLDLDDDAADERAAMALGDSLFIPNEYAALEFAMVKPSSFEKVTISIDSDGKLDLEDKDDNKLEDTKAVVFSADSEIFSILGEETDTVWVTSDDQIWYDGGDDEINSTLGDGDSFNITIDDEVIVVTVPADITSSAWSAELDDETNVTGAFQLDFNSVDDLYFFADVDNDYFGAEEDEEAGELVYNANKAIGSEDYTFVTTYGVEIEATENQFGSGASFELMIPSEQREATLVVKSMGSSVAAAASGSAYMINPIDVGMGMLDSEATLGSKPMIVVGGPYVNSVAKELLGFPTDDEIAETFTEGKAGIWWFEDEQAMLVAGWSAQDTRGASYVVANYDEYDFEGSELEVVVTDLKNIDVMAK